MPPHPERLSRRDFAHVLGLTEEATPPELRRAAVRLLEVLRRRRPGEAAERIPALEDEIAGLESALRTWGEEAPDAGSPAFAGSVESVSQIDRTSLAGAMVGAAAVLLLLIAYANGYRIEQKDPTSSAAAFDEPARLILTGRLPGATLRVLDADRTELFAKTPAEGAMVELREGRYALEVSREDCPDTWTRSLYFDAGATRRFEPFLCAGEGQLTLRSNVPADRMQIDGFDVDPARATPHALGVGDHAIRLEKKGYSPYEARIRIAPDEELTLRAELTAEEAERETRRRKRPPGLEPPEFDPPTPVRPVPFDLGTLKQELSPRNLPAQPSRLPFRPGFEGLSNGGSTAWHDQVSGQLIGRFDADRSGLIDRVEESEAISCALWKEIEVDFDRGGLGLTMARYYGFDGSEWHPRALGFSRKTRSAAYEKMKECGLAK